MKNLIYCFLILGLAFCWSCQDDDSNPSDPLYAKWKLISITGGLSGGGYDANFTHLDLQSSNNYQLLNQDTVKQSGTFEITENQADDQTFIAFTTDDPSSEYFFSSFQKEITYTIEGGLILNEGCCDLYTYEFVQED